MTIQFSIILKFSMVAVVIIGFTLHDLMYSIPVEKIRIYNIFIEFAFAFLSAIMFLSINGLKEKTFYKYLSIGFFLVFVSMLVDGLDQFHLHGELYTALFEKSTLLIGFVLVYLGMKAWIVDHRSLNQQLETQAYIDELTGLYNRRGMLNKFEMMSETAEKNHQTISFIIADIDDFKVINDTSGHFAGDQYLAELGSKLMGMMSENAIIGRWGGEEFAICMLGSDLNSAYEFAEKIRCAASAIKLSKELNHLHVTMSLGVSEKQSDEVLMDTIKRADRSLYRAKDKGKNQSVAE